MGVNFIHQEIKNHLLPKRTKLIADFAGYAYSFNKVILDNNNSIINFFVLEVNSLFEEYLNLRKKDIVGRKITDFFQEYENEKEKWNVFFTELALSGVSQIRLYLKSLNRKVILFAIREDESLFSFFIKDIESGDYEINTKQCIQKIIPSIFLETNTDAIVISQFDNGLFLMVNKGFSKITGYSVDEIIGKKSEEINIWANKNIREQIISHLWKDNIVSNIEARFLKKDGKIVEGLLSANLIEYNGLKCILSMTKDITELKKKLDNKNRELKIVSQKAEESDRLKKSFLANVSHEIRTPLNAVIGFAQLLKNNTLPLEKQKENLELIHKGGCYLLNIMNNIIDISKIESGIINVKISKVSLHIFLREVFDSIKYETEKNKEICFFFSVQDFTESNDIVWIDVFNTKKVLSHLISNAIKFTNKGDVELGCKKSDENELLFFIRDTGIGIHEAYKEIIYERFRQIDESSTRRFGGLGLGLSIAKDIINKLGGDIWFTSEIGNGTIFYFTLPYKKEY